MIHTPVEDRKLQLSRINQLAGFAIALFVVLVARLWYLQVVQGADLLMQSESNRIKLLRTRAPRGTILDRKGRILATSRPQFVVLAVPEELQKDENALGLLCSILDMSAADLEAVVEKSRPRPGSPVRVKIDVPLETVARIGELHMRLPGVSVELDQIRDYPEGPAVAHIMGYLGEISEDELAEDHAAGGDYRPGDYIGKAGLEKQYESDLRGIDGGKQIEVNAAQRVVRIMGEKPSEPGKTLKLGVDRDLQIAAFRAMGNQQGAVVAIDPRDGSVLAMVSKPSFDPNIFVKRVSVADWNRIIKHKGRPLQNRCVYNVYPPGSIFKPVMAIAGLVHGLCSASTTYNCPGSYRLGRTFGCWKVHGGGVDFMRAMAESCDVWYYHLGHRLEIDRIAAVARQFGLGSATGIDLPRESRRGDGRLGVVPDRAWKKSVIGERWYPGDTINCSIGQGYIQTSPLQMAVMCAAVASDGNVYRPRLVTEMIDPGSSKGRTRNPVLTHKVDADSSHFRLVQESMRRAVTHGTGKACDIPDIAVGGKTGSAENPGAAHGWFISFAPVENPTIAVACLVEHGRHGSSTAAPVCRAILDVYFGKKKPQEVESGRANVGGD